MDVRVTREFWRSVVVIVTGSVPNIPNRQRCLLFTPIPPSGETVQDDNKVETEVE